MAKQTSKAQLLQDIHTERRRLEKTLATLDAAELVREGVVGTWSVKDVLAHLVAWEKLFLAWYQAGVQGSAPATLPVGMGKRAIDALNLEIYTQNQGRSLEAILEEFRASYRQILAVIEGIPESDMFGRGRFNWTGELALVDYIAGNTCSHYAWARSQISKWVKRETGEGEE
jgi:hypothetical protein